MICVLEPKLATASGPFFFRSDEVPAWMAHTISKKVQQSSKMNSSKVNRASQRAAVLWSVDCNEVSKSTLGPVKMYSDKRAASFKCNPLAVHHVHVVLLNLNTKRRKSQLDYEHVLLGFFPARRGEMEIEGEDAALKMHEAWYGFTSSEAVVLQIAISHISSSSTQKRRISAVNRAGR